MEAFETINQKLSAHLCIQSTYQNKLFYLFVAADMGTINNTIKGGLGAALVQFANDKSSTVGHSLRSLKDHETNNAPNFAEQAAAVFDIEHFSHHLLGRHFTLCKDHKTME